VNTPLTTLHFHRNLLIGLVSWNVSPWQAFSAWRNVTLQLTRPICKLQKTMRCCESAPLITTVNVDVSSKLLIGIFWQLPLVRGVACKWERGREREGGSEREREMERERNGEKEKEDEFECY